MNNTRAPRTTSNATRKTYNDNTARCTICGNSVSKLETFPGGRCLPCWEKITYRGFTSDDIKEAIRR